MLEYLNEVRKCSNEFEYSYMFNCTHFMHLFQCQGNSNQNLMKKFVTFALALNGEGV